MPDTHAKLSASGSQIWMNCPPAIMLSEGVPDQTSEFAEEGTVAHSLAEISIRRRFEQITSEEYIKAFKDIEQSKYYNAEMLDYINTYVDWVEEVYHTIKCDPGTKDIELMTEQRLDFSDWVPGGFGTGDVVIIADGLLTVIDLKYGKGIPISAKENPQLMLYGLGAYDSYSLSNNFSQIQMMINQPRLDSISSYRISVAELLQWGEDVVKPAAAKAAAGEGEPNPGEWCRFCKVKAICRARAEDAVKEAKTDFKDPALLTDEELSALLAKADRIKKWAEDLKDYAQKEALKNHILPGWKLVEGKSSRKWSDPNAVAEKLILSGYESYKIYKPQELLGITDMSKVVGGKAKLEKLCEGLIVKSPGAPTLVPNDDKRQGMNAKADFD